jgi:cystathionine beta-lyase/cystathionine gamma-synthase
MRNNLALGGCHLLVDNVLLTKLIVELLSLGHDVASHSHDETIVLASIIASVVAIARSDCGRGHLFILFITKSTFIIIIEIYNYH